MKFEAGERVYFWNEEANKCDVGVVEFESPTYKDHILLKGFNTSFHQDLLFGTYEKLMAARALDSYCGLSRIATRWKDFDATEDDIRDVVEDGYEYTEEEIRYLSGKLDEISDRIAETLMQYRWRGVFLEVISEIIWEREDRRAHY